MGVIDELKANGFDVVVKSATLELQKDEAIIFEIMADEKEPLSDNELCEEFIKEVNVHLDNIESEDEDYFYDCDADYLKGEWKELLLKIHEIVLINDKTNVKKLQGNNK